MLRLVFVFRCIVPRLQFLVRHSLLPAFKPLQLFHTLRPLLQLRHGATALAREHNDTSNAVICLCAFALT